MTEEERQTEYNTENISEYSLPMEQKILSDITTFMKYARYEPSLMRRETWEELVDRNKAMHLRKFPELREEIEHVYENFVKTKKVVPSMRSLQFAGPAIELANQRIYNCSFHHASNIDFFSETLLLLLQGCFKKGTLIETANGPKPIEEITLEDEIKTYDTENDEFYFVNPVWAGKTQSADKPKMVLSFDDGSEITCTEDHLFFTENRGWVEAKDLTEEDDIKTHQK